MDNNNNYIAAITQECKELSDMKFKEASVFLELDSLISIIIIVFSGIVTYIGTSTSEYIGILRTLITATVCVVCIIGMKYRPYKRGYKIRKYACKIKKLGKRAEFLSFSKLSPNEVSKETDTIIEKSGKLQLSLRTLKSEKKQEVIPQKSSQKEVIEPKPLQNRKIS